ncbi:MAG: CinA family protein [Clostridiales bacterium]|nr:CinA family protein [Clostridiales bacterium]
MLPKRIVSLLREKNLQLAVAESCTGGLLTAALTAVPGCSECFGYGLITYSNESKERLLKVARQTLEEKGAVSAETARAMARGVAKLAKADIGLAITGIAGPGGATPEKPCGLVYLGLATAGQEIAVRHIFSGNRGEIRAKSVEAALKLLAQSLMRTFT